MSVDDQSGNQGIQAGNVTADVIAVGKGASATKNVAMGGEQHALVEQSLADLRSALDSLVADQTARSVIEQDVARIQQSIEEGAAPEDVDGILEQFAEKLKMVGVIAKESESILKPIKQIGSAIGLALGFLL